MFVVQADPVTSCKLNELSLTLLQPISCCGFLPFLKKSFFSLTCLFYNLYPLPSLSFIACEHHTGPHGVLKSDDPTDTDTSLHAFARIFPSLL